MSRTSYPDETSYDFHVQCCLTTTILKHFQFSEEHLLIFYYFVQNIDCGYTLEPSLTSTHSLCFGAKIRKYV